MSAAALPARPDLVALDADGLAALTNRGLVKRAAREADRDPPRISAGPDAAVVAEFSDGVHTELPLGGLERGTCSCGAAGVCRHLLALVFAFQQFVAAEPAPPSADVPDRPGDPGWSPGEFSDADLAARIGTRLVDAARRKERAGYTARVRRGATPVVELASATVRFLVPHDLGYVHTDARAGVRDDVIALAVWAFRAADAADATADECTVDVGGSRSGAAGTGTGLEAVVEFAAEVLRAGVAHAGDGLAAAAAGHVSRLEKAGLRWPLDATAELAGQLAAYRERSARYTPETTADLIAELFARHRAAAAGAGSGARSRVLGTEEAAETPLRRVRLDGLGARVTAVDDQRRVEIFHAQPATGVVLVSDRAWTAGDDGPALARRRLGGATIGALAGGTLVTESAVRSASRMVRLTNSRVSRSTVTVTNGAWASLPPGLLVRDFAALAAELDRLPPRPVRARVRAELVRVLAIAEVGAVRYAHGAQRLTVEIRDAAGVPALVTATHAAVAPGRLDALAAIFTDDQNPPRYVSGSIHRRGGHLVADPYAVVADGPAVVPDLMPPSGAGGPGAASPGGLVVPGLVPPAGGAVPRAVPPAVGAVPGAVPPAGGVAPGPVPSAGALAGGAPDGIGLDAGAGSLASAVAEVRLVLADVAHSGLAHLPPATAGRLHEARRAVARVGLHRVAAALDVVIAHLGPDPGEAATTAWVDAYLRVGLATELL